MRTGLNPAPVPSNPVAIAYHDDLDLLYVMDSGVDALLSVGPSEETSIVVTWDDNPVPTGIAVGPASDLYVALFSPLPYETRQWRSRPCDTGRRSLGGHLRADDPDRRGLRRRSGTMYVLELSQGFDPYGPELFGQESGRLLRVGDGGNEVSLDSLAFPTGLAVVASGTIYLTNHGGLSAPHTGVVLRLEPCPVS